MEALQRDATLRDWFAALSLSGVLEMHRPPNANVNSLAQSQRVPHDAIAAEAYAMADAMLKAREPMARIPGRELRRPSANTAAVR